MSDDYSTVLRVDGVERMDTIHLKRADFVVDPDNSRIGLRIQTWEDDTAIIGIEHEYAKWLFEDGLALLYSRDPELFKDDIIEDS